MRLARETWLLLAIGLLDLLSTVWLIHLGIAGEANPMMDWYLQSGGLWVFCVVKAVLLVCPLMILEWARRVHPSLGQRALRFALAGYLLLYCVLVWRANEHHVQRLLVPRMYQVSRRWRQGKEATTASPGARLPMVMPIEQESLRAF